MVALRSETKIEFDLRLLKKRRNRPIKLIYTGVPLRGGGGGGGEVHLENFDSGVWLLFEKPNRLSEGNGEFKQRRFWPSTGSEPLSL